MKRSGFVASLFALLAALVATKEGGIEVVPDEVAPDPMTWPYRSKVTEGRIALFAKDDVTVVWQRDIVDDSKSVSLGPWYRPE